MVCGLAACRLERSAITRRVAARLAGPADATVFGLEQKVASANAAYANAEMMNALDADERFYNAAHFAAIVLAASLAEAERLCSSGADILKAFIAGFEINARLNLASKLMEYDGEQFRWSPWWELALTHSVPPWRRAVSPGKAVSKW
ncbi:MAG: MmgE/PrpD family protein [Gammaproteobacteria bacterium]|nr:MmgE/PrpD family protein [Gammaproteobacteria bacterium]